VSRRRGISIEGARKEWCVWDGDRMVADGFTSMRDAAEWLQGYKHTCPQCDRAWTLDGQPVTPGLRVWDYDLNVRVVAPLEGTYADPKSEYHDSWDGFYTMLNPETGSDRCSKMTGDRMWVRHPFTREQA
jgi:hypothetical protein